MSYNNENKKIAETRLISMKRVSKVISQGKRIRFSVMVVAGNRNGSVGIAIGRGLDTKSAVEKAERKAIKNMKRVELLGDTVPHEVLNKFGAAKVLLRPAKPGAGVIAGSSSRIVLELAGVVNVYCKQLGSNNPVANAYCTYKALTKLRSARVLDRMKIMQERVGIKEKLDIENKKKLIKKKKLRKHKISTKKDVTRKSAKKN